MGHIPALDGIRGLAVLMVLVFHFAKLAPRNPILDSGWVGVDLFFALSGFLITGILLDTRGSEFYLRNFWIRRALRIFPLYYFLLIIAGGGLVSWLYLNNWIRPSNTWLGHTWSLAVEEQFYFTWPFVIGFLPRRKLPWICLGVAAIAFGARVIAVYLGDPDFAYYTTICRMDGLALGALAACLFRDAKIEPSIVLGVFVVALLPLVALGIHEDGLRNQTRLMQVFGYPSLALAAASLVFFTALRQSQWPRVLREAGKYSYGLYVYHYPLSHMMGTWGLGRWTAILVGTSISTVVAVASFHLFEARITALKDRLTRRSTSAATLPT